MGSNPGYGSNTTAELAAAPWPSRPWLVAASSMRSWWPSSIGAPTPPAVGLMSSHLAGTSEL